MDVNNPLKMVLIGIDPYPYVIFAEITREFWISTIPDRAQESKIDATQCLGLQLCSERNCVFFFHLWALEMMMK